MSSVSVTYLSDVKLVETILSELWESGACLETIMTVMANHFYNIYWIQRVYFWAEAYVFSVPSCN